MERKTKEKIADFVAIAIVGGAVILLGLIVYAVVDSFNTGGNNQGNQGAGGAGMPPPHNTNTGTNTSNTNTGTTNLSGLGAIPAPNDPNWEAGLGTAPVYQYTPDNPYENDFLAPSQFETLSNLRNIA
jgi:hypothetical protein